MGQKQTASEPAQTFETAIERLEEIVEEMEGDKLALEKLLERYEEGSKLVKVCQDKLEAAEKRVEIITRGAAGKPQVASFEAPATEEKEPSPARKTAPAETRGPKPETRSAPAPASADVSLF